MKVLLILITLFLIILLPFLILKRLGLKKLGLIISLSIPTTIIVSIAWSKNEHKLLTKDDAIQALSNSKITLIDNFNINYTSSYFPLASVFKLKLSISNNDKIRLVNKIKSEQNFNKNKPYKRKLQSSINYQIDSFYVKEQYNSHSTNKGENSKFFQSIKIDTINNNLHLTYTY